MKRKVVQQGPSTLMVSLPAIWVREQAINKGDELNVAWDDAGSLIVTKGVYTKRLVGSFDFKDTKELSDKYILRVIRSFYRYGYDEVKVTYDTPKILSLIRETLTEMIGFEIMEHTQRYCIIKSISETLEQEFESLFRKLFFQLFEISRLIRELIQAKVSTKEVSFEEQFISLRRISEVLRRILNKKGYKSKLIDAQMLGIVVNLRKIGNEYRYIYRNVSNRKYLNVNTYFKVVEQMLHEYHDAFFKRDDVLVNSIMAKKEEIFDEKKMMIVDEHKNDTVLLHHLSIIIRRIHDICEAYFAITFKEQFDK